MDYNKILNLYTTINNHKYDLKIPFKQHKYYCATNIYVAIIFPDDIIKLDYPEKEKPDLIHLFNKERNTIFNINIEELKAQLIPNLIDEYIEDEKECSKCDGDGVFECEKCGNECDCEKCNGDGKILIEKSTGNKIPDINTKFRINDIVFKYELLKKLVYTADILNEYNAKMSTGNIVDGVLFEILKFKILMMPLYENPNLKIKAKELNINS